MTIKIDKFKMHKCKHGVPENDRCPICGDVMKDYLKRFKRHYNKAVKNKRTQFSFDKQLVLVSYAKYYIEYLETVVNNRKP